MNTADGESYRPGVCNIGGQEVAKRRRYALLAAAGAAGWLVATTLLDAPAFARALAGLPAAGAFLSWYEAERRFCVSYAALGVYRLGAVNEYRRVRDGAERAADLRALVLPLVAAAVVAVVVAGASFLLP